MDEKLANFVALLQRSAVSRLLPLRPSRFIHRRPWAVGSAAGLMIALAGALGWIAWGLSPPSPAPATMPPSAAEAPAPVEPQRMVDGAPAASASIAAPETVAAPSASDPPAAAPSERTATPAAMSVPRPAEKGAAGKGEPAWLRYAVPAPAAEGRPRIAIIIDDLGLDKKRTVRAIALKGPLTLSFLAYATDLPHQVELGRSAGHELLLHVPMEPLDHAVDTGPNALETTFGREEILRRLRWDLGRFDGYVGISNHMGSRFTSDVRAMTTVLEELKARGLLFLDSRTIASSAGSEVAQRLGVPHAARDVFLDNEVDAASIAARLAEVDEVARRRGSAIAIGHPHDMTLDVLAAWLAGLPAKGLVLVPVSALMTFTKGG